MSRVPLVSLCTGDAAVRKLLGDGGPAVCWDSVEGLKFLVSLTITLRVSPAGLELKLRFIDVRRVHFNSPVKCDVFIRLPWEDAAEKILCGQFKMSMYGTRDAAANW